MFRRGFLRWIWYTEFGKRPRERKNTMRDRAAAKKNSADSLFRLANGIGLAMLGYIALGSILSFVWDGWAADRGELVQTAVALARYAVSLLVPFALACWALREEIRPLPHPNLVKDKWFVPSALAAGLGVACVGNLLAWLMQMTAAREGLEMARAAVNTDLGWPALAITFVGYSLLAALVEEIVFRGVVLRMLRPWGDLWAVWCSAVLFALCHASPLQFIPALLTGALLGALVVITGGIRLSILVHTCYNALAMVLNYLLEGQPTVLPVLVIWAVLILVGAMALVRLYGSWIRARLTPPKTRRDFYCAPVMLAAAAFMLVRILHGILRG